MSSPSCVLVIAAVCCLGCSHQVPALAPVLLASAPLSRDAKVYQALLDKAFAGSHGKVVLKQDTVGLDLTHVTYTFLFPKLRGEVPAGPQWAPKNGPELTKKEWKEASESFQRANVNSSPLPPLDRDKLVTVVTGSAIHQAFAGRDGWQSFYKLFPGATGLLSMSRPGYSTDGHVALVGFYFSGGLDSAEQDLAVLELGVNGWSVSRAFTIVIA